MQFRFDEEKQIYRDCSFCGGKGCLACPGQAKKDYDRAFPNGPGPVATFKTDDPDDMQRLKDVIGSVFGSDDCEISKLIEKLTSQ